jgi:hypothetical protein
MKHLAVGFALCFALTIAWSAQPAAAADQRKATVVSISQGATSFGSNHESDHKFKPPKDKPKKSKKDPKDCDDDHGGNGGGHDHHDGKDNGNGHDEDNTND